MRLRNHSSYQTASYMEPKRTVSTPHCNAQSSSLSSLVQRRSCRKFLILVASLLSIVSLIVLLSFIFPSFVNWLTFAIFGRDLFVDKQISKGPIVQLVDDNLAMVSWESWQTGAGTLKWDNSTFRINGVLANYYANNDRVQVYRQFVKTKPGPVSYSVTPNGRKTRTFNITIPAVARKTTIRIAALGDSQFGYQSFSLLLPEIMKHQPDAFLHLGDMAQNPWKDSDWQVYFFDVLRHAHMISTLPFLITQGNHDVYDGHAAAYFPPPNELPHKPVGNYYALTLGAARIIVMDSNSEHEVQLDWLKKELKSTNSKKAPFRIVIVHVPPFIEYWEPTVWRAGENNWSQYVQRAVPIFEKYKVDLVLSGHQHNYQRGVRKRVTYVISGGGGGPLDRERVENWEMYEKTIIEHHYILLDISESQLNVTMMLKNGDVKDNFLIKHSR